jgi:hypothetical protein
MDKLLETLIKYQASSEISPTDISNIDNLIKIIDLSIYNNLRYAEVMSHLKLSEFQLISKAYKYMHHDKELETLNNLFNKKCSI